MVKNIYLLCTWVWGGQEFRQGTEGLACLCYPMSRAGRLKVLLSPSSLCSLHKRPINPRDELLRQGIQLDFFNNSFYLFMTVLSLPCCTGVSLSWPVGTPPQPQYTGFSCFRAQALGCMDFSSCKSRIEPISPTLTGRFFTTETVRKPKIRTVTSFRKPADREDGRLMSQNNHLIGGGVSRWQFLL